VQGRRPRGGSPRSRSEARTTGDTRPEVRQSALHPCARERQSLLATTKKTLGHERDGRAGLAGGSAAYVGARTDCCECQPVRIEKQEPTTAGKKKKALRSRAHVAAGKCRRASADAPGWRATGRTRRSAGLARVRVRSPDAHQLLRDGIVTRMGRNRAAGSVRHAMTGRIEPGSEGTRPDNSCSKQTHCAFS